MAKTNAARILDAAKVAYELRAYEIDASDLSATTVARKIGMAPADVWKTLVARGDRRGVCFAIIAADMDLDLRALARLTGNKKVDTVGLKEVEPLTGYVRGGVTVFGSKKAYPVFADDRILASRVISVSAGARGAQLIVDPREYVRVSHAKLGPIGVSTARQASDEPDGD